MKNQIHSGRSATTGRWTHRVRRQRRSAMRMCLVIAALVTTAMPAWPQEKVADLTNQSIEDLMNVEVTSVSKTEEKLSKTASAVFVISQEDIRRSGATNIPDLLRMVPGMDVAQINANTWAISARGFNGRFSNELMVLVDGRSVYTPTFGGVFWDVLDMPLENIERIEVIRGPGGSIWGENAVNGVVNIITKKASETKGGMVVAGGGNLDRGFGTLEYGGSLGKSTDYRVYTKYLNQDNMPSLTGQDGGDGWHVLRGGFRVDSALSAKDTLTLQGDMYTGQEGNPTIYLPSITSPGVVNTEMQVPLSGGFLQAIWNHVASARSDITLQISYDNYERDDVLREGRRTFNVDFQHHFQRGDRQNVVWGLGYRDSNSDSDGTITASLNPRDLDTQLFGAFFPDEIALVPDRLYLTVGARLEHNYYTGFNFLPSARVAWVLNKREMVWVAISRVVRSPAAIDASLRLNFGGFTPPGGTPVLFSLLGNPHIDDENLIAYEAGYRSTFSSHLSVDLAAYYNNYSDQETTEPDGSFIENTPAPPHIVMAQTYMNLMHGETHGIEIAANWKATNRWTLSPGYALEQIHMHLDPASQDTTSVAGAEGSSPAQSAQVRSHLDLPRSLSWDASAYFVGRLTDPINPSYTRLDTGLTWKWHERVSVSLVGQNLLKNSHLEFTDATQSTRSTLVKRNVYAKLTWRY
jgi:iron complex outermembrane receptor protein